MDALACSVLYITRVGPTVASMMSRQLQFSSHLLLSILSLLTYGPGVLLFASLLESRSLVDSHSLATRHFSLLAGVKTDLRALDVLFET